MLYSVSPNQSRTDSHSHGSAEMHIWLETTPCAVPPVASPRSCSQSPQHINGRLSPSPISSPRAASGASTPPGGGNLGAIQQFHLNNLHEGSGMLAMPLNAFPARGNGSQEHKPDIFRGLIQAHLSLESVPRIMATVETRLNALFCMVQKKNYMTHI